MSSGVTETLDLHGVRLDSSPPKHGGDLAYWQREIGGEALAWLDLSSACNREPWPISNIDPQHWTALPDQEALFQSANAYYGLRPSVIGAGSQQIIEALPLCLADSMPASKRVYVPRVGYQEHAYVWQKWGYELAYYDALEELLVTEWAVAVIIQPNNPTGQWASQEALFSLIEQADQTSRYLIVDEAFIDPVEEKSLLRRHEMESWSESLFVLRSVGKFFGLAGARVGFAFCSDKWQNTLRNLMGPWPVSTPSLHLVSLALQDTKWQAAARESLEQRQAFFAERVMPKFNTVFNSQDYSLNALFCTWRLESQDSAHQVFSMLHAVGVHVRLGEAWIRVALPAENEMEILDSALIRLLKGAGGRELA